MWFVLNDIGTSLDLKKLRYVSDSGFNDEPHDADSSTPWQRHSGLPTKQGNSSSGNRHKKGAGGVSHRGNGGVGEGTGNKDNDEEEQPPGKDGENLIDITAPDTRKKHCPWHLDLCVPLHEEMPPEVLRDETEDQAPSDFNLKPPPLSSDQLSASATSGFSENAKISGATMLGDPRKLHVLLHQRLEDSGFSSGQVQVQPVEPLPQDILHIPRRKPASIASPESSRFHTMVTESHGVVDRDRKSATGDQSTVTADTTFAPEQQQLAPLHSRLSEIKSLDIATPYSTLEYFDRENQQQDNILGSPCTPFVLPAEQHIGGYVSTHTFLYSGTSLLRAPLGPAE